MASYNNKVNVTVGKVAGFIHGAAPARAHNGAYTSTHEPVLPQPIEEEMEEEAAAQPQPGEFVAYSIEAPSTPQSTRHSNVHAFLRAAMGDEAYQYFPVEEAVRGALDDMQMKVRDLQDMVSRRDNRRGRKATPRAKAARKDERPHRK